MATRSYARRHTAAHRYAQRFAAVRNDTQNQRGDDGNACA